MCVTMKQKSPLKLMENSHHQKPSKPPDRDDEFQTSETPLRPSYLDRALWRVTEQEEYKQRKHNRTLYGYKHSSRHYRDTNY